MKKVSRTNSNQLILDSVIGKTLDQAKELAGFSGFSVRVTRVDEERYFVTMDLRFDRINLELENGIIVNSNIG